MSVLDPDIVEHVRTSWNEAQAVASRMSTLFYDHLFTADPTLIPLFKSNERGEMEEQGHKLMHMIGIAVDELTDLDTLVPMLRDLGHRHVGYGVREEDYQTVRSALLKTLADGLGERFTPETEQAWAAVYDLIEETMLAGAHTGQAR